MALLKIKQVETLQTELNKIVVVSVIDSRDSLVDGNAQGYANTAESNAISTAAADATTKANTAESNAISTAAADATTKANTAESNAVSTAAADATAKANTAESNAVSTAAADATSKANAAEANAITSAGIAAGSRDALVITTASTAAGSRDALVLTTADTAAGSRDALLSLTTGALDARVSAIEGVLIEDDEFFIEKFVGASVGPYRLVNNVQDDEIGLVWAYVNGVLVSVDSVSGQDVTLAAPGYDIDGFDEVTIHYQGQI